MCRKTYVAGRQVDRAEIGLGVGLPVAGRGDFRGEARGTRLDQKGVAGGAGFAGVVDPEVVAAGLEVGEGPRSLVVFAGPEAEVAVLLFEHEGRAVDLTIGRGQTEES